MIESAYITKMDLRPQFLFCRKRVGSARSEIGHSYFPQSCD
jgi:hypothetical protein